MVNITSSHRLVFQSPSPVADAEHEYVYHLWLIHEAQNEGKDLKGEGNGGACDGNIMEPILM